MDQPTTPTSKPPIEVKKQWYVTYIFTRRLAQPGKGLIDFGSGLLGFDIDYFPIQLAGQTILKQTKGVSVNIVSWVEISQEQLAEYTGQGSGNAVN